MTRQYRSLKDDEIQVLVSAGCHCGNWERVIVAEGFNPQRFRNVHFSGDVRLGVFDRPISFVAGFEGESGIYNSTVINCSIGDNVYINNVHTLANYRVDNDCVLTNITYLAVQGLSTFGNGTVVKVIIEAGGREVKIYDNLSAQIAYITANYRHRKKMVSGIDRMIDEYCKSVCSDTGTIGRGTKIMNCGTLKNVAVGPNAILEGVNRLENGSINSSEKAHVRIGANVIAKDFIIQSGAKIIDNVILDKVFVGQSTELSKGYSAESSMFFANCGGFHGEACAVFAGPFTVTHHKATLLIAGMFSFFNAGSGSNQSNHMYKLGANQQGIFERGCKMGSGTHVVYPARLGAFNVIIGKHESHPDTRDLPFSYVLQTDGKTLVVPGYNLLSSGTLRDMNKWPSRDNRKDDVKFDHVIFDGINPYTAGRMLNGIDILRSTEARFGNNAEWMEYNNMTIKGGWTERGIEYYRLALDSYFGGRLAKKLKNKENLEPAGNIGIGRWVDVAGLIAPKSEIDRLCGDIEDGVISEIGQVGSRFADIYNNYADYEWAWIYDKIRDQSHGDVLGRWKEAFEKLGEYILNDAKKEFNQRAKIPFGIDGDEDVDNDFLAARGRLEDDGFVQKLMVTLEENREVAGQLGV